VLDLVAYAWAGFGAAFGPVLLLCLHWQGMTRLGAMGGILIGSLTVIIWHQLDGGIFELYELEPGFFLAMSTAIFLSVLPPLTQTRR